MDNNNDVRESRGDADIPRLTLPTEIVFPIAACVLTFIYAIGVTGLLGSVLAILASALNVLYALNARDSALKLSILLAVNILPFAAAAVYLMSMAAALTALYPLITAMLIWLTVRRRMGRAVSIAASAIGAIALWLISFALTIYDLHGALNVETINATLDYIFEPVHEYIETFTYERDGQVLPYFTDADIESMIYYVKTVFIGGVAALMIIQSYFTTLAARVIANAFGVGALLPMGLRIGMKAKLTAEGAEVEMFREPIQWRIELDSVSAGIFIAAYVVSILFGTSDGMLHVTAVAQNLIIILSPGFIYCGVRDIVLGFRGKASIGRMSRFIAVPLLLLAFINPSTIAMLLCALGIIVTFRENGARRKALQASERNDHK